MSDYDDVNMRMKRFKYPNRPDENHPGETLNPYDAGEYKTAGSHTPMGVWKRYAKELAPYAYVFCINKYYTQPMKEAKEKYPKTLDFWMLIDNNRALQEVFLSVSIQHGHHKVKEIFMSACQIIMNDKRYHSEISPEDVIKYIYHFRVSQYSKHKNRYEREERIAFDILSLESYE